MFDEQDRQYFYNEFKNNGYEVGSYDDFKKDLKNKEDRDWYYNEAKNMGYDVGTQADFDKMVLEPAPSTSGGGKQVDASATTQSVGQKASTETKPQVAQPAKKQETTDKEPGLIAKVLDMIPTGVQTSNGTYQPSPEIPQPVVKGEEMPVKEEASSSSSANAAPVTTPTGVVNNEGLMDAKLANYIENWKQRPDKQSTYFENMVADLLADGTANSNEEAVNMVMPALRRYANRSAMDVTNQIVSSLPDDTVQDAEQNIDAQWYSHGVQDKLKQEADSMGISYDDYVGQFLKPAMVQSLVNKYGPNYRNIAEGIATRLYSHDENVQDRLMNQDINNALSSVISKYVSPSVVDEYNKAQEAGSKAFAEGMEGSQFIPANLRLGTALGAQYEANEAKDPAKVLSSLQKKFGRLYRNPKFLNDMSNAAFKVMQRYGLNGTQSSDPKQFKPMINAAIKNELDQLEVKGMMPKGSAEYIMKTGLGNTIVGKIIRKAVQTDYQNWLEDIANQQYQPGFWENVASGALTFAGDAWSYWLPGAAGGKLTKSMVAKAEGRLAGDLMAKGMERKMAERAAKVLIGKSKAEALKSGAVHGAVTFGGQSAISKPIDEVYRTGQFDENGKIYNPSVGKVIADTLGEVAKQSAVGAIMQGGTIANMVGKGRGLATNILADVGGKVVDSGIMTGHQILERMAQDPNFKPTGKDAAESFLESMANLTAIGLPGMVGKYARFKDAREFNKKFDFTDQDIAELKRFGYDGLRDAFEKMGIGEYAVVGENAQRLDGQLTQKYMDLMNDKSVPEVLKAKMMAVVEGKRPSSFSPVVDSIIVQPMDHDGKVYLETLNKDGGIIDRKEFSSLDEAQKADKKLEYEKTLGLASVLEGEFHNEFTQEHLEGLYNKAAQKYNMGEKLTDEDKAAVYLHQNAGAIKEIMDKQQKGIILTDEEQKQVNAYRHYYDSALENSSVMREFVNTFEDSHDVAHGTLRKALESKDKKYAPLVESYLKELYNSIELKREMKQTMDDFYNTSHGNEQKRIEQGGVEGEKPTAPVEGSAGGQEPPVSEGPSPYQGNTDVSSGQGEGVSTANSDNSSADVITSDAFVMGQNAYKNEDSEALQAIGYNSDLATGRLKRAFADNEKMPDIVANAYNEGRDMEQFVAQRASSLTPAQKEAISKYVEAMDAKKGAIDALQHADDGYGEALKQQLWPYQTVDGNIVPATLDSGKQVFLKKDNEYGGAFVVVPDEQGLPTIKQVSKASIIEKGTPVPLDEYIENAVAQQKDARNKQFISQFDGTSLKPNDTVSLSINDKDQPTEAKIVSVNPDGTISFNIAGSKNVTTVPVDTFNKFQKYALRNSINAELDAEDVERAEKEAIKAEADKKQRYANGIVGLSEGQPDYSSKDTDAKVAAEYLQEQFGEDHGKLLNLVNGSRDDIETQLANKKKAAAEYRDWLDVNADLDPEKAQKVENDLALVNEQIADLDARFKNWNTIRNSVMTPDEVKAMKEERKAEIEKAGVDKSSVLPDVDTGVRIPENSELKDKYPTQEAASGYITSERRRVYKMQEETQREIDGVDKILNQYMDGDMELSAEQLRDLNTTKAELANRQNALTADAKALKGKAESLNILYIKERAEQNKKNLEALSPKDRRKELVAKALEKKDMKAIKEIYKDASTDVMDLTPRTLEEFVSERLFPHSLNAESLAQELGSSNFRRGIGSKYDTNKYNYLLANNGEGLTISELAKRVWEDLSGTMESGAGDGLQSTYTDQDIRNTILDMFKTYDSVRDMRNVTLLNRIAAAENELSGEEEWYEQQKEREIFEKQKEIDEYNSYIHDKELSLPSESELDHIHGLEFDRMMEIEDREREYKQYVKSILPELADYDDRSNEEGYGGGSSLGSDSSRRGVDEGNSQGEEVGNGEASSESEIGEGSDSGRKGRQETGSMEPGEGSTVRGSHLPQEASFGERLKSAIAETETEPTEAQKKAGNYKKGHLSFGGYDYTVETPKGVTRSGKDEQGKPWSVTMHDTYGYILGKIGVDGDHIDMFINDAADLDTFDGNVYVVDQVNPETGVFDEHKVMYGYPDEAAAITAYAKNYSPGWKGLGKVTSVPKATFDKWLESSDRKTKPFREYAMIQHEEAKKAKEEGEMLGFPAIDNEGEPINNHIIELVKWAKEQGLEIDPTSKLNSYADLFVMCKDDFGICTLVPDEGEDINQVVYFPDSAQVIDQLGKLQEEFNAGRDLKHSSNIDSELTEGVTFYDADTAREFKDFVNKKLEKQNKFHNKLNSKTIEVPEDATEENPLGSQLDQTNLPFHRNVKEVKPSEMTEAQKVAYDAVSTMLKKAGIPVKVVSNEDMEKVAEAQDNSLFAKYKDLDRQLKAIVQPGVRFLRTYHGSGADFTEFDFNHMSEGAGSQTFGWGGYVTSSDKIGKSYAKITQQKPTYIYNGKEMSEDDFQEEILPKIGSQNENMFMDFLYNLEKYGVSKAKNILRKGDYGYYKNLLKGTSGDTRTYYEGRVKAAEVLLALHNIRIKKQKTNLYEVDIPEDNGSNYLDWDASIPSSINKDNIIKDILDNIQKQEDEKEDWELESLENDINDSLEWANNGEELYKAISLYLGDKTASKLLASLGYTGIKYKAGRNFGGVEEGDANYVIFKPEDMKIVDHTKFAQGKGVVYGYTDGKEIVLNQEHLNPNTPIHEYQHLWRTAAKNMNPELIEHGDKLIMQTQLFDDLKKDPNYNHLTDEQICDEAFARLTGEDGAAILEQMAKDAIKENPLDTAKELSVINKLKEWLKKFWYWTLDTFTKWKPEDIKKMTLEDIRNLVLRDLANGVDPRNVKSRMTKEESVEEKIKAVSQQFGVDEADVAMYANAVKKGSTAEAARARANIKRHLLQANEDKISSLKELLKYTVPVNNALKENFGDLDAMIEERVKQVEAQRNAMEAARKRAEEEEAKRQKHLEELSVIPDDQLDKQYMDALAKGDDATAREMLDEAARRKGYDDTESAYQGVGAWAAPGNPGYESDKARRDDWESSGSDVNLEDIALGYAPQPDDYFSHPERYSQNTPHGLESVKAINAAIDAIKNGEKDVKVKVYRAVPTSVKEGKLRNGDWVTPSKKYADIHGNNRLEGKYRIIEDEVPATQLWWDGNDANEFGFDDGKAYKYKNAKNNRKLNDLVTYDNKGDVIPPSKRFNSRKSDIRFHRVTEPEELDRLNKEKTFRMYSGMQEVDGKLYSPMAAIIDGKRTDATEIGAWMGADERPDLVKGGKFQLVKTDKNPGAGEGPVRAAYNPYMHTSTSMMNDQFSGAYARGNIKVVEWEIPESEKTSGYRAEGAKDAVGLVPWHSGSVNSLLPKDRQRQVMLSRWRKAVRVVPDSEVAESIAEQLEGTGLAIPWNVVTPNQVRELAKLGVPITTMESGKQAPETKEKFMAQMDELKKEFPQAQFVDVKMTKDAFKGWGILKFSFGENGTDVADGNGDSINKNPNKNVITRRIGSREQAQRRVNETLGAAASDRQRSLGATTKEQRTTWNRRSALGYVRRRAEELSSLLTEKDLEEVKGIFVGHGQENYVYRAKYDPTKVIKFNDFGLTDNLFRINEFIDRVNAHNQFQPKDKYTPIGFAYDEKGDFCIVMEQPYLKGTTPTREEITQYLTDHGFKLDMIQISADEVDLGWTNGEFDLWDAEPRNVIKDENGDLHFFDTMIQHTYIPNHKNPLRLSMPSIRTFESQEMKKSADKVKNVANVLGGAEAVTYTSSADVPEEYRVAIELGAKGWYDPTTHTVHVYLPNCEDGNDAQRTVFHEKIGHEGMEVLLGGEDGVRKFANFVYRSVGKDVRGKIIDFANKYDPDWKNPDRMNVGTQEYIAHLAEEGPKTAEDFSLWTKIKHYLIKVLKKLGVRVPGLLNDKDLRYYLMKAGKALHVWDNMPKEKQEAMMKQASNAEIKDSLSDGANLPSEEDNKPKKKTERGRIDEATGAFKLAPNGEQSNLSKKQYIEARTKNFKDWFGGDWEKKPKDFKNKLDANGEPLEKYVEGYLNRPKKPTMPKKRKGEDEATFFGRKMLYSQALEDWPKTEADWKKRIDEFDENTLAALTPPDEEAIREKYQKQYENDMASWRKDHPYIKEGEERPLEIPDMRDYQSIQDYGEALRKHEIWKTAPHKDEYDRMAEDEIISKVALMDAVQHPFSEYARLKTMKAEFQHMRHVMQNQKVYDQNTTDAVVQFAKRFMSLGYGDDLGRGSINTLLTIVKNSTGKKSYEISQHLYQVMDVLMNNQLRNFDRAVMKTMSIKELKENAKGIQVQGKLELRGQTTIKAFRDAVSSRISSDKLDEKISNLIDKMAADKKNASSYQDELLGLNLAKQYVDYIDSSRNDAIEIEDMKRMEIEGYKNRKGIYEGELTKALLQEHVERLNQYDDALFNNKVERMERYSQLLANLGGMIDESVKGAREFQVRDARRAIKVKMMASADLGGKSMNQHHKENWKTRLSNSDFVQGLGSPLGSFDALMREFGSKQINGEGHLWNHFVRGAMKASNEVFKSVREANNEIDLKVSELFGKVTEDKNGNKKGNMTLNDLYALERSNKVKSLDVTIRDIEGEQTYKLQQGNLMYIYMVNKMPDGAMKLRQMGILDADVERIKENIDPRFLKLADWIQGEFLPKMRTKYNKRHEELFGAPMPMVENYFPLRVLKNARYVEEDVNNTSDGSNALPSTATGAIIKRKINKLPLDILNADALSVTIDNINEMENWYNYAPIRKDANTLLSDTTFRNRVQNMTTIYGSRETLWNNVKDATAVAMGTYRPTIDGATAVALRNFGKGITGAKISFRLYTAFKQVLSAPLFLPDVDLGRFVRHSVHPYGSFKWAIENLPNFDKRWSGRKLGDTVLMDDPTDWKLWHTNLMEKAAYYGMTPNALVDAVTCAVGARAVYDTKYKQYIKYGLTEERAKEKALSDAEINFNTSQQSSEGAFVSPMQLDKTLGAAILTPFRNSSMLYERKGINALRNLKHRFEKGHKEASIKFMAGQLMEEGVGYEQATKAAEKMYKKGLMHNIADAIVSLWLGAIIWNLGGSLGYLIPYLGDDENKKKKMVIDAVILGLLEGPVDGLAGGQFINTAIANTITSDGISLKGLKNVDFSGMPMLSDFNSMIEKFGYDKVAGAQDLMFIVMQSATGFNPKTLTDAINACIDYGNGDMTNAKEIALFVFRLMNGPAATVDNLYIDELGMKGKDAKKLSYDELAKRYAEYKFGKNTFGLGKLYSDEEKQKKLKAIEKSFDKKVSERLAGMDREDLKNEFSESRSQKEKKLIGKIIADELETKDSEAVKKAKADASYLRQRNFSDLMDDLYLQKEWETTNAANAGLEELKGNGASEEEIEAYKTKHKADFDKRKAIQNARKEMQKKKADISSDNDEATMAAIRKLRDSILKTVRQKKK